MTSVRRVKRPSVLVSGVGVAGPTLAYWLLRAGMAPVLVESAPSLRQGGYAIDFWGPGFEVVERMGLDRRLRDVGFHIAEIRIMGADGRVDARLPVGALTRTIRDRYFSILRSDLSRTLYEAVADQVETRFGDEVVGLQQGADGVDVTFRRGQPGRFDLVIGADGLHSNVRRLALGPDSDFETPLGYYFAAFVVDRYPHRDLSAYVSRTTPGRQVARYSLADGRTTIFMILTADLAAGRDLSDRARQRAFLAETFDGVGWEAKDVLEALNRADDLYFDTVSQVQASRWSRGRVCLVGDAAYCPSLFAGEGASFGMAGAYILAGELAAAAGDHRQAFRNYQDRLQGPIARKQRSALRMGAWFAPRTPAGVFIRNLITRLAGVPGLSNLVSGGMFDDGMTVPRYGWIA